ncbi:MAG TPA: hypothetical protein VHJ17_12180, partial [Thermomonospora sp.]|nr:hypothetical protein [Thermomonospora sp.]
EECEAVRFALALLAGVCPTAARSTGVLGALRGFTNAAPDPHRAATLRLALALAEDDTSALTTVVAETTPLTDLDEVPSPYAPIRGVALNLLKHMAEKELSLLMGD